MGRCVIDRISTPLEVAQPFIPTHQAYFTDNPEPWDFEKQETIPDIVVINLGTNDNNAANNVSSEAYVEAYKNLIRGVHGKYPEAKVIVMV